LSRDGHPRRRTTNFGDRNRFRNNVRDFFQQIPSPSCLTIFCL
jgi:hypothetical protein